jgi:hypothetical protein
MSYDVSFCVRRGSERPTSEALRDHFGEHVLYAVAEDGARYENEATGSSFSFAWAEAADDDDGDDDDGELVSAGLSFEIGYARPHSFALEARLELERVVERFGLSVNDPQLQGMGIGPWDAAAFVRGWLAGNQMALSVLLGRLYDAGESVKSLPLLPEAEIRRHWQWNYARRGIEEMLGVAVPRVFFFRGEGGRIFSMIGWPDAQPLALPGVDCALLHDSDSDKRVLVEMDELGSALELGSWGDAPMRHLRIEDAGARAIVAERLASGVALEGALDGVGPGEILDLEAVLSALQVLRDG